ncbi:MAG: IS110 family transposase [Geodermatophilaceae bacterium]
MANQLRAHLQTALPGVVGLFRDLDSTISLKFLHRFDTQDQAGLAQPQTPRRVAEQRRLQRTRRPGRAPRPAARRPRGLTGPDAATNAHTTQALLAVLTSLVEQIRALTEQIGEQLDLHTDAHIFTSLPRSGTVRAARLLAEIGDCRARFPTPEALACLAGVAPSTRQSGKTPRASASAGPADKQLRDAVCDFAGDSRRANPWADKLYRDATARGHDHPHAVRILARAWLYVIWHCWQNNTAYDPTRHNALQRLLSDQNKIIQEAA